MFRHLLLAVNLVALPAFAASRHTESPKALFYLPREAKSVESFMSHLDKIDVLSPNWYALDKSGAITGEPDAAVLKAAKEHHIAVSPLVTNLGFIRGGAYELLMHPAVHRKCSPHWSARPRRHFIRSICSCPSPPFPTPR